MPKFRQIFCAYYTTVVAHGYFYEEEVHRFGWREKFCLFLCKNKGKGR
nr:MAG TPA: hypothetical protein [Caudoviricetes sp.]